MSEEEEEVLSETQGEAGEEGEEGEEEEVRVEGILWSYHQSHILERSFRATILIKAPHSSRCQPKCWRRMWLVSVSLCSVRPEMVWHMPMCVWTSETSELSRSLQDQYQLECSIDHIWGYSCRGLTDISVLNCFVHVRYVVSCYFIKEQETSNYCL